MLMNSKFLFNSWQILLFNGIAPQEFGYFCTTPRKGILRSYKYKSQDIFVADIEKLKSF
jgi:hypothetical protein